MNARKDIVEWIDKCVLGDLRTVVLGIEEREKRNKKGGAKSPALGGGNFRLAADCFDALEYFGRVYDDKGTNEAIVQRYVERFLNTIDPLYIKVWPILWDSFRNGIVHSSWTKPVRVKGCKEQIAIGADNSPDGDHLKPASDHEGKSFVINSYRFFCDIKRSFNEEFRDWILNKSDEGILERAAPQVLEIQSGDTKKKEAFDVILKMNT